MDDVESLKAQPAERDKRIAELRADFEDGAMARGGRNTLMEPRGADALI